MKKQWFALHQFLAVAVALYGVMSACVCNDHAPTHAVTSACHQCASSNTVDTIVTQIASHHVCCGMERAPIAVEKVVSTPQAVSDHYIVLPTVILFVEPDAAIVSVSSLSHAPPGDIPIYLTTQRFVI